MRVLTLFALLATATAVVAAGAQADPGRNLEAVLRPAVAGPEHGFGLVTFRQPKDDAKIVELDVWVRDLLPHASYRLQRATDTDVSDGECKGANWLTLGQGLAPAAIATDDRGTGRADLFRDLAAVVEGSRFDIKFRVLDASDFVVLESGCYQFTLSQ